LSKKESPSTFGLKGATSSLSNNFDQSKSSNQGWDKTSRESAYDPNLLFYYLCNNLFIISLASLEMLTLDLKTTFSLIAFLYMV
jgi:hypothetical protein